MPPIAPGAYSAPIVAPLVAVVVILALMCLMMIGLRVYRVKCTPHPEVPRKLLHVTLGLVTLTFPWLFADVWPVAILACAAVALLIAVKRRGPLRALMGGVVDGVERTTSGDLYFPVVVALLFWLARGDWMLYCIPILLLTLGDSAAALIGIRYGRRRFFAGDGKKSMEGSLACFVVCLLCTLLPLVAFTPIGRFEAVLIATDVAIVATVLEALCSGGLDNLLLPIGGYILLKTHIPMSMGPLSAHLAITAAIVASMIVSRRPAGPNGDAALGALLYGYWVWSIGGIAWLLPPLFLFIAAPLVWPRVSRKAARSHTVGIVFGLGAAGLVWQLLAVAFQWPDLIGAYYVSFAAQMAMIGLARLRYRYPHTPGYLLVSACVTVSWVLLIAPFVLELHPEPAVPTAPSAISTRTNTQSAGAGSRVRLVVPLGVTRGLAELAGIAMAAILFDRLRRDLRDNPCDAARWRLQSALGAVGSIAGLAPMVWRS